MTQFTIMPDGPFSLEAASHFGFGPNTGRPTYADAQMKLAFVVDDFRNHAFVTLNQQENGDISGTIESDADPEVITALLADPRRIPGWAPAFADAVTWDTEAGWRARKSGQDFALLVVNARGSGTVDYLREGSVTGARLRS